MSSIISGRAKKDGKLYIILNPIAGKGKALKLAPFIEQFLKSKGENFEIVYTTSVGHAQEIARTCPLENGTVVVAAGGDGTSNEVVNGLLSRENPSGEPPLFGILPIGRGNDFSSSTSVPSKIEQALETLISREYGALDAGIIKGGYYPEGRYFVNGVGIGFDTMVGLEAAKMKYVRSGLAYVFGAIKMAVVFPPSPQIEVRWSSGDEEKSFTDYLLIVSIVNGRRMGGSFYMGPDALLNDGELDLCAANRRSRAGMAKIILHYTKGTQHECEGVTRARSAKYSLRALEGGMVAHADGETICLDGKELEITCVPSALRMVGV
ncbi:MAG: diacylglycerol kinase family lipid kinase [Treponemataceae bacterium]|nr:MAG: diacylglycerol kinase family lipid kinase [Treponemataceae bacterium]